jgi:hypothetical protein
MAWPDTQLSGAGALDQSRRQRQLHRLNVEAGQRIGHRVGHASSDRNQAAFPCPLGAQRIVGKRLERARRSAGVQECCGGRDCLEQEQEQEQGLC